MRRETSRVIARAAQDLVRDRGLSSVTVEDITRSAGVSERTFYNYFSCKEEAIAGLPEEVLVELDTSLRAQPRTERPLDALRAVLSTWVTREDILRRWGLLHELVSRYPTLLPQHLAALLEIEAALTRSLAERMGVDPESDPSPRIFVAAMLSGLRAAVFWWEESGQVVPLKRVLDQVFDQMAITAPPSW